MLLSTNKQRRFGKGVRKAVRRARKATKRAVRGAGKGGWRRAVTKAVSRAWKATKRGLSDAWEKGKKLANTACHLDRRTCRQNKRGRCYKYTIMKPYKTFQCLTGCNQVYRECKKSIAKTFQAFEKVVTGIAKVVGSAVRGAWNWMLRNFNCFGLTRAMHTIGYGYGFPIPGLYPPTGAAFAMTFSMKWKSAGFKNLFAGFVRVKKNFVFALSIVIGLMPNFAHPDGVAGGVRAGLGFGGGLACGNECVLFITVGHVMSALMILGYGWIPPKAACIFGPIWPLTDSLCFTPLPMPLLVGIPAPPFPVCFKCFEAVGVSVSIVCCEFNLTTNKDDCR